MLCTMIMLPYCVLPTMVWYEKYLGSQLPSSLKRFSELHRIQIHFATLKITVQNGLLKFEQYQ